MFKLMCKYGAMNADHKAVCFADKLASLESAQALQTKLKEGNYYHSFKIVEYTQKAIKTGTAKSNAIKIFFSKKG